MAVDEPLRSQGAGSKILRNLITHAATQCEDGEIWCNGRVSARGFYQRHGFEPLGDIFDVPFSGPHYVFLRPLRTEDQYI